MKRIPSFCITLLVVDGAIIVFPTFHGSSFLVSTRNAKKLRTNLEAYVERFIKYLLR